LDSWPEATRHDSGITLNIHSLNHDNRHPSPAYLALGYKRLQRLEEAWRTLKSGLRLRPDSHWAVHRIHAHVVVACAGVVAGAGHWAGLRQHVAQHASRWRSEKTGAIV